MNYTIGDSVICIDATPLSLCGATGLIAGHRYTIVDINRMPCCGKIVVKVAGRSQQVFTKCLCGKGQFGAWSAAWRFIKLDALEKPALESVWHKRLNAHSLPAVRDRRIRTI